MSWEGVSREFGLSFIISFVQAWTVIVRTLAKLCKLDILVKFLFVSLGMVGSSTLDMQQSNHLKNWTIWIPNFKKYEIEMMLVFEWSVFRFPLYFYQPWANFPDFLQTPGDIGTLAPSSRLQT